MKQLLWFLFILKIDLLSFFLLVTAVSKIYKNQNLGQRGCDELWSFRRGSQTRPSRRTCRSLREPRNRTRRRTTETPRRTEVRVALLGSPLRRQSCPCVIVFLPPPSDEDLCEHGFFRPKENQDEAQEVPDQTAHLSGGSGQRLHQRWSGDLLLNDAGGAERWPSVCSSPPPPPHRSGVRLQSEQSVPAGEHDRSQLCQDVHGACGEHRYEPRSLLFLCQEWIYERFMFRFFLWFFSTHLFFFLEFL